LSREDALYSLAAAGYVDATVASKLPDLKLPLMYRSGLAYRERVDALPIAEAQRQYLLLRARRPR
jgi:hypothetical protein